MHIRAAFVVDIEKLQPLRLAFRKAIGFEEVERVVYFRMPSEAVA